MRRGKESRPTSFSKLAMTNGLVVSIVILISIVVSAVSAQDRRQLQNRPSSPGQPVVDQPIPNIIVSPGEDYRIGPSDVIDILIEDAPELSRTLRVSADGTITTPFLGRVPAQQKTPDELAKTLADRLRGEYLEDPQVTVTVRQINSRTYFVQGAVRRAGLYQIEGQPSLLKLITIAGGLTEDYGSTAFIIREVTTNGGDQASKVAESVGSPATNIRGGASNNTQQTGPEGSNAIANAASSNDAKYELIKVNINGLLRGNFDQNVTIAPGDIVHIPPTDVFFVAGEVNAPGSFALKEGTTLRQAISLAQGTSFNAAGDHGIIFREDPATGKRSEIKVDIPGVMSGKKADIPIVANDIVIVPNSRLKSIGGTLLRAFGVNSARIPIRYGY